jgi:hypothetical protein
VQSLRYGRGGAELSDFLRLIKNHISPHLGEYDIKLAVKELTECGLIWPPYCPENVRQVIAFIGYKHVAVEHAKKKEDSLDQPGNTGYQEK